MTRSVRQAPTPDLDTSARHQIEVGIAASGLLQAISERGRSQLATSGHLVTLDPGEVLFEKGDESRALYVVIAGEVEVRAGFRDGSQIRFAAQGAGAVIGEMGVFDSLPRSADVIAITRARLWRIPKSTVLGLLESEPSAALSLIAELARRLRAANEVLQIVTLRDLGARLARLLINEAGSSGFVTLTQTEMARRISASREKVNRKLHAFADDGLIALSRAGVRVMDPDRLTHLILGS